MCSRYAGVLNSRIKNAISTKIPIAKIMFCVKEQFQLW
ncbi:hypothetical protein APHCRT_0622 [Anaplasma phagocytophilum str. CRT53-1]|uniref:Uncharacterized protein n=4 Tax=Anaplasma phagocytophilum TaxID=948 RepID=A0A0F3PXB3_ANAPH|nr:hypothetical protein APH_0512 [Anaplasma phagocytophilum str. HZ]KJV59816.1 hypothetical protein APHWEB_1525 [Anaplasma phagocytophilum str. Webster]KJV66082.1 hypothetical protein EPHNCH_0791 [Anaplasma phagocytophilum str. NCH-1]KJV82990.1 hypothetical protein APHHGE2_0785 [Anaplasma phagocytophilum str. HGE2]KJV84258.1 hypothetical protein APHWI1_1565 [Anaplasma phagocytophilum str. ApWI1]KJV86126.1 hypothetical protein APHCRT_0610 [Anaplasma phagocytophilum str. CRT53-1]KJV87581.1 hypo